jgi:fructokinase
VSVVDAVGAGDAFSAALLAGLYDHELLAVLRQPRPTLPEDTLRGLLTRAGTAAALTCTRPGADPPRTDELADVIL